MTTGKRVHTGEEWARSLERRLTRLEQGLMKQSTWTGEQGYVPSWWGTCADTSVEPGTVVTMASWTAGGSYKLSDPAGATWTLPESGIYSFGFSVTLSVSISVRAFVEVQVNGVTRGRQTLGASEDRVGASWAVHCDAGNTVWFSAYQTTGSTVTLSGIEATIVRLAGG